ncbi:MAG: tyrosine-protein phosphatase [Candidatus Gastranaerophilaceae bacterium]
MFRSTLPHKPNNYKKIDETVSRSAQPEKEDFAWLREQGVTDIINFRTMYLSGLDFDEKSVVEKNGMKYHNIPTYTNSPEEKDIGKFLDIVDDVHSHNGKVHIHCKAGADRTGMYSWIYKQTHKIGDMESNKKEMLEMGHHSDIYPNLIRWIEKFLSSK